MNRYVWNVTVQWRRQDATLLSMSQKSYRKLRHLLPYARDRSEPRDPQMLSTLLVAYTAGVVARRLLVGGGLIPGTSLVSSAMK